MFGCALQTVGQTVDPDFCDLAAVTAMVEPAPVPPKATIIVHCLMHSWEIPRHLPLCKGK